MDKKKVVAVITGAISILIGIAYLVLVQLIDFRGEMIPAPVDVSINSSSTTSICQLPINRAPIEKYVFIPLAG